MNQFERDIERALKDSARGLPAEVPQESLRRLAERASDEGVLDVAYARMDSPLGEITVAATPRGLVRVAYDLRSLDEVVEELAERVSPRVLEAPSRLDRARRELDEYFQGRRREFDLELDWSLTRGFFRQVLQATALIDYGRLATYSDVATSAGSARAVRAAGNALGSNPMPVVVPCHRVVRTGGALGGYTGGVERKEFLLELEGVLPERMSHR